MWLFAIVAIIYSLITKSSNYSLRFKALNKTNSSKVHVNGNMIYTKAMVTEL